MDFLIDSAHDGKTVRSYIKYTLHISSRLLTVLKQTENGITVNGSHVTVRHVLHAGDLLSLDLTTAPSMPRKTFHPPIFRWKSSMRMHT